MATLNVGIKISAAVSNTLSGAGNQTLYTAPANAYAIVNIFIINAATGTNTVAVGGRTIDLTASSAVNKLFTGIYVGPGQSVTFNNGSVSVTGHISGTQFINTI